MVVENRLGRELPQEPVDCKFRSLYDLFTIKPYLSHGRWQSVDLTVHSRRERSLGRGEPGIVDGDTISLFAPQIPASSVTSGSVEIDKYTVAGDAQSTDTSGPPTGRQVVGSATLQLLFWGGFWEKAAVPSTGDVTNAVARILASPYLSQLDQYGFTGLTLGPSTLVYADVPSPTFTDDDVNNMVWDLIDQNTFPEPEDPGGRNVYMIFAPAGTQNSNAGYRGAHGAAKDNDKFEFDVNYSAWVGSVNHGSIDFITQVFSHELVEILTDPEPNSGFQMNRSLNGGTEIGDACNKTGARAEGILLQAYWSERHKACIVPRRRRTVSIVRSDPKNDLVFDHVTEHKQVTVTPGPLCPEGTYCYKRHALWESITFTAIPYRFNNAPSVSWTLAGKPIPPNATGNVVFTTETRTPEPTSWSKATAPVTVNYQTTATSLTITNNPSDANYDFDVV
jgi:hypothetical protein